MMLVRLVRHGEAENRLDHHGGDASRPLTPRGRRQADALARLLDDAHIPALTAVYSSPAIRCMETVRPTARRAGLSVVADERLAEGATAAGVLEMLHELNGNAVLCSHGDVIGHLVDGMVGGGLILTENARWQKASTWLLDVEGGVIVGAAYEGPPG